MDCDDNDNSSRYVTALGDDEHRNAVNSVILDYYKKIGRKRDLEQYFSLSTANSELRDPTGSFWRRMKSENDSSDSGERKSENTSSQELCRISIRCSVPEPCSSQEDSKTKTESVSPPIITEDASPESGHNSDADSIKSGSVKSEDNQSQKSYDVLLDTSINKPFSPTSSITSQRKLEWDSLADVGYANESDRKTSAGSLSTLERLALLQQYSNNDNNSTNMGMPTAHSTPLDENETKSKTKKGIGKKTTKIYQKDVDLVELNLPECSNKSNSINVNLTKHISFNVEKDGKVTVENVQKDVSVSPEKTPVEFNVPKPTFDKEIQTSLVKTKEANVSPVRQPVDSQSVKIPVMISLNTLRKRTRRKKLMAIRKKIKQKKPKESVVAQEKSGEQLSEAESFEYMPGHIYNQNQLQAKEQIRKERPSNAAGNKSSLESSGVLTTDSSKSIHSFSKDLEKSIELLKNTLKDRDDANLRKQLIKQICERLIKTKYRDDDSTISNSDFLSTFTFTSKKASENRNFTTTSTSDGNDSGDKFKRPKKSILRNDKFDSGPIASTSQSVPNLSAATDIDKPAISKLMKQLITSNTDSEISSKEKSSDTVFAKASSEELYQKYLAALRREQAYKQHLKDKETFLKQKLGNSDNTGNVPSRDAKVNSRLRDLIKDLTRNNYDDGSGDASKLEGGPNSNTDFDRFLPVRTQRSHSVFTLSSGNSDYQKKKCNLKKRLQSTVKDLTKPGPSNEHYCCCPHHSSNKPDVTDSSVQVNIKNPSNGDSSIGEQRSRNASPRNEGKGEGSPRRNCSQNGSPRTHTSGNFLRRESGCSPRSRNGSPRKEPKCSPRDTKCYCICGTKQFQGSTGEYQCVKHQSDSKKEDKTSKKSSASSSCSSKNRIMMVTSDGTDISKPKKTSKSSQTNLLIKMLRRQSSEHSGCSCSDEQAKDSASSKVDTRASPTYTLVYEATRCLQTEISINPKVSEPTLSDVNIVTDSSCAKLISEGYRETEKPSGTDIYSGESGFTGTNKSSGTSKNMKNYLDDQCIAVTDMEEAGPSSNEAIVNTPVPIRSHTSSQTSKLDIKEPNYEIPIQGTNMTLLVSINSNERKSVEQNMVSTCVGTDIIAQNEQGTCLAEENSKGVQYERVESEDVSDRNVLVHKQAPMKTTCATNTFETSVTDASFNTYPKRPINERPAFCRPTDPSPIQRRFAETDLLKECPCNCGTMNCNCVANAPIPCKKTEIVIDKARSCGWKHDIKKNDGDYSEHSQHKASENEKCSKQKHKVCSCGCCLENCSENCHNCDTNLPENKEICFCGCSKNRDDCGKSCNDCNVKSILDDNDINGPCPCGCGETKGKCHDSCSKLPQPSNTVFLRKEVEKCSCGCSHNTDDCGESCAYCKVKSNFNKDDLNGPCPYGCGGTKLHPPNAVLLRKEVEKCSCGCSKDKGDCDKSCSDCKVKLEKDDQNGPCPCGCGGTKDECGNACSKLPPPFIAESLRKEVGVQKYSPRDTTKEIQVNMNEVGEWRMSEKPKISTSLKNFKDAPIILKADVKRMTKADDVRTMMQTDTRENKSSENDDLTSLDPIMEKIQSITRRYSKKDLEKSKKKKCFKEIMNVLTYLLDTEDSSDRSDSDDKTSADANIKTSHERAPSKSYKREVSLVSPKNDKKPKKTLYASPKKDQTRENTSQEGSQNGKNQESLPCGSPRKDKNRENTSQESSQNGKNHESLPCGTPKKDKNRENTSQESRQNGKNQDSSPCGSAKKDKNRENTSQRSLQNVKKQESSPCGSPKKDKNQELTPHDSPKPNETKKISLCESSKNDSIDETEYYDLPKNNKPQKTCEKPKLVEKGVQSSVNTKFKQRKTPIESSDLGCSEMPGTSTDSATCKILNKIRRECDRYHQKRCKIHGKKFDGSSSTSVNCDYCRRVHHCHCRTHKCKSHKKSHHDKYTKKPIAYNLIIQTSDSMMSEENPCDNRQLKNVVVKVPQLKVLDKNLPFKEVEAKIESRMSNTNRNGPIKCCRSRSMPNESEISSLEEIIRKSQGCTVREYLEKNRPDFVKNSTDRLHCLKFINGSRETQRAAKRDLLSLYVEQLSNVNELTPDELQQLAKELGRHIRQKKPQKLISEREMKKHSEKIYKSLPEVVQKKEDAKKENEKKSNLLMASIFKKNLQKKTLRGSVNLSNYSTVVKI